MRLHILRTLVYKEALRQRAHPGTLALAGLPVAAALVLALAGRGVLSAAGSGVECCFIDYWQDGPWVEHLRRNVPPELRDRLRFRPAAQAEAVDGVLVYPPNAGAIQLRPGDPGPGGPRARVWVWHPADDAGGLTVYEAWFWKESARYFGAGADRPRAAAGPATRNPAPAVAFAEERFALRGGADRRGTLAAGLVLFALFFAAVYLLPAVTAEERERGLLLAQALTPASPGEILTARALFFGALGVGLAALVAVAFAPAALTRPFFGLALAVAAAGLLGVGLTVAALARTPRAAGLGALGYLAAAALLVFLCRRLGVPGLPWLALEYHCPSVLHAGLAGPVLPEHWAHLGAAAALAAGWGALALGLFRRRGWQ